MNLKYDVYDVQDLSLITWKNCLLKVLLVKGTRKQDQLLFDTKNGICTIFEENAQNHGKRLLFLATTLKVAPMRAPKDKLSWWGCLWLLRRQSWVWAPLGPKNGWTRGCLVGWRLRANTISALHALERWVSIRDPMSRPNGNLSYVNFMRLDQKLGLDQKCIFLII